MLVTWLNEADVGGRRLVEAHGYGRARTYYQMVRPNLEDVALESLPDGIEVRPVTEARLPDVFAGLSEAFRDHFGGYDDSAAAFRRCSGDPNFDAALLVIAFEGDAVVAGVCGRIDPTENAARSYLRGWTDPIFTRRPWRRRGLASALLGRALSRLREAGMTSAQLDVDVENVNSALRLYGRHGFAEDGSTSEWHRPFTV
jgi:mycothiol synthase